MFEAVCPQCDRTYADGAATCDDCGVELALHYVGHDDASATRSGDDRVVELTRLPTLQAEIVTDRLRSEGIPAASFAEGFAAWTMNEFTRGRRVVVLGRDRARAQTILDDLFSTGSQVRPPVDDAELAAQADAATGYSDPDTGAVV